MKLSVVLATFNEEENISKCLDSVKDLADEIIVVDGGSTDKTVRNAEKYQAKIVSTTNPPNFHINKQKALEAAHGEWILQLDADEIVSSQLKDEIKKVIAMSDQELSERKISIQKKKLFTRHQRALELRDGVFFDSQKPIAGFFIPRANIFLGRSMRYAGMYPDGVVRLVKNGKAFFPCKDVHEQIQITGAVSWLEENLIHFDSPTFEKYINRANRYTTLTAEKLAIKKTPINYANTFNFLVIKPTITFCTLYFRHKGFKDGFPGFVFSIFSGLHHALAYMKYATSK